MQRPTETENEGARCQEARAKTRAEGEAPESKGRKREKVDEE